MIRSLFLLALVLFGLTECCPYKNIPIVWYWDNEIYESVLIADNYCIYDFASPFIEVMDQYEAVPAHFKIFLPPRKDIKRIIYGPNEDRCFFYTENRGIAIIQDLHGYERKYENGLKQITKDEAENQLGLFLKRNGKEIKVKDNRKHYMFVDNEIRIVMYNLTDKDYHLYVEFPLENLKIRQRGGVRLREKYNNKL